MKYTTILFYNLIKQRCVIKRNSIKQLSDWLKKTNPKPLIIRGARQVGKSHLVRLFARENELTLVEINLERHLHLNAVFATNDTAQILKGVC